jgi:hypothetical protein
LYRSITALTSATFEQTIAPGTYIQDLATAFEVKGNSADDSFLAGSWECSKSAGRMRITSMIMARQIQMSFDVILATFSSAVDRIGF